MYLIYIMNNNDLNKLNELYLNIGVENLPSFIGHVLDISANLHSENMYIFYERNLQTSHKTHKW